MSLKEPKEYICLGCSNRLTVIGGDASCPRCGSRMRPVRGQTYRESAIKKDFDTLMDEITAFLAER